jgi:hypothetical protein
MQTRDPGRRRARMPGLVLALLTALALTLAPPATPTPKGDRSYAEIGRVLSRSPRWAATAVATARRRETAGPPDPEEVLDGSVRSQYEASVAPSVGAGGELRPCRRGARLVVRPSGRG